MTTRLRAFFDELQQALLTCIDQAFPEAKTSISTLSFERPPSPEMGDLTLACFPLARILRKAPPQIAAMLAQGWGANQRLAQVTAAGPYLNFQLHAGRFAQCVCEDIVEEGDSFGRTQTGRGERVMVEYSSPNTNKPLHVGHVRNQLLGMAVANLLEAAGFTVIKANLVNDRGIHICKSMLAYQKWGNGVTPQAAGKKGDAWVGQFYVQFEKALKEERNAYATAKGVELAHFAKEYHKSLKARMQDYKQEWRKAKAKEELRHLEQAAEAFEADFLAHSSLYQEASALLRRWEEGEAAVLELWRLMNGWVIEGFHQTYALLGCKFDKIYRESETYTLGRRYVEEGLRRGVFYQKEDRSIWVSAQKLLEVDQETFQKIAIKDKLLLRGDGTSVYITQDIGTAILKAEDFQLTRSIYVVADEQILHFQLLFGILRALGFPWAAQCVHLAYGMVTLPHGMGRLKSREGTAIDADALIEEMVQRAETVIGEGEMRVPAEKIRPTALRVALAALKIFMLQVSPEKNIQFDPRSVIAFTGDTGPAIQYSYARIMSIFENAAKPLTPPFAYELLSTPEERALLGHLAQFPQRVSDAAVAYAPHLVANYLLELTKFYARFYHTHRVLQATEESLVNARLCLCKATAQVIKNGLALLGVEVVEQM